MSCEHIMTQAGSAVRTSAPLHHSGPPHTVVPVAHCTTLDNVSPLVPLTCFLKPFLTTLPLPTAITLQRGSQHPVWPSCPAISSFVPSSVALISLDLYPFPKEACFLCQRLSHTLCSLPAMLSFLSSLPPQVNSTPPSVLS